MIPYHSSFALASLVFVRQIDMLGRHEPFPCVDRLGSDAGFCECTHSHLVRSLAAVTDERGCNAAALEVWVAEADIENW
jgi:hypothetical protein